MLTQCLVALQNITKHNHTILYANPKRTAAAFPKSPDRVAVPRLLNLQEAYLVAPARFPNLPQVSKAGLFPQFSKKAADQLRGPPRRLAAADEAPRHRRAHNGRKGRAGIAGGHGAGAPPDDDAEQGRARLHGALCRARLHGCDGLWPIGPRL